MYESRDASIHHAMPLPPLIRDPDGSTAAAWDVMQVSLLIYLATVLPLRACFAIDVPAASPAFVFDVFTDIVFIIDLLLNFRTAYYDDAGLLEERPRKIASNYLHGWFAFDFVSCLPLQYFSFSGGKAAKALRLVRLAKMLRLAKMKRLIGARLGSRYGLTSEIFGFTMLFAAICYTAHLLTCLWYVVGTGAAASSLVGGVQVEQTGWVQVEYCCAADESPAECSGQCEDDQLSNITVGERYVTSIYYVFNALEHATLSSERGFAVCAELTIGLIFGSMAGLMS